MGIQMKNEKQQVSKLTLFIKANWKKSVESLIDVGKGLHQLKSILDRKDYLEHIKTNFAMSEMQSGRLINLYLKFKDKKTAQVLASKPSVLYIIASQMELKKVEQLAKGGKILVEGKYKTIDALTLKDIHSVKEASKPLAKDPFDVDEDDYDLERAKSAHRRFATFIEEISDWATDIERFKKQNLKIENEDLLKIYLQETIECLINLKNQIM